MKIQKIIIKTFNRKIFKLQKKDILRNKMVGLSDKQYKEIMTTTKAKILKNKLLKTKQKKFSRENNVCRIIKKLGKRIVDIRKKNVNQKSGEVKKWGKSEKSKSLQK